MIETRVTLPAPRKKAARSTTFELLPAIFLKNIIAIALLSAPILVHAQKAELFPLSSVKLLDGPFLHAQQADMKYMLSLDADRLLAPYRKEAGLTPKAQNYGNWENTGLDGHIGGHYLSALANMYAATGNKEVKQKLDYAVAELLACQEAAGNGYTSGVPGGKAMWENVAAGKINANGFSLNGKWVPLYNIHKTFAGLYDAYTISGNEQAKKVLLGLTDWFYNSFSPLTDAQIQDMLRSEHGGLNEVFADVAQLTGEKKYLELAKRFSDQRILQPLLEKRDALTGLHANTQIPKVVGYNAVAKAGGDPAWREAADFFWNTVVRNRSVSIGGNSVREHFHPTDNFSSMVESREGPETCNSYNMLRLSKGLFLSRPSAHYMDYYERTLFNHILSSQHPETGGFVYFTPMRPGHYRVYSQPQEGFWCCVGSGLENHGKYGELIYAHQADDLFVNLFMASELHWKEKGLLITQTTAFPESEQTELKLALKKKKKFKLMIRKPSWIAGSITFKINGKAFVPVTTDSAQYISIERNWKNGDKVTVELPMETRAERLPDQSEWVSFVHGPIVLAAPMDTVGLNGLFADASRMGHVASGPIRPLDDAPMLVGNEKALAAKVQAQPGELVFNIPQPVVQEKYANLQLRPFYMVHDTRYTVYFPFTEASKLQQVRAEMKQKELVKITLDNNTIDRINAGEQQPESDHAFKGEKTETGLFKEERFRNAKGWFSYEMNNKGGNASKLRVVYFGRERNRSFDIYVQGQKLASVEMKGDKGDDFYAEEYALPASLKAVGGKLEVKFVAREGSTTANVYEVRLMK